MAKPVLHLICNAHLDPVWQWRWEEGAAEAIATFDVAARLLREFPGFVFNHNEAILYRWIRDYDAPLFREIQRLVAGRRWCIAGGWDLQPDVNMPGTEAIIRHIAEGRRFFLEHFNARPIVAYNLDSFGHSGGLPQILRRAGYRMYIHMRPGEKDLHIPSDLYRWKGVDGSVIPVYRIPFAAYNTFHDGAVERINEAIELALKLGRDTPVFWGLGDHGGGATRSELEQIQELMGRETRVQIVHSSTEAFYAAIQDRIASAPMHEGDLNRVFTGCYTSMSRLKRTMQRNLGELIQTEAIRTATWWTGSQEYPEQELQDAWRDHLFNDFHDILPGSSIEAAEFDALDLYGRSSQTLRRVRLGAASGFSSGPRRQIPIPVTVLNANPAAVSVPVEVEYMIDHVPRMKGEWHARLTTIEGNEIRVQEEAAGSLLLKDEWRRKICFTASLPQLGAAYYSIGIEQGPPVPKPFLPAVPHSLHPRSGVLTALAGSGGRNVLLGEAPKALVIEDLADSWGMEAWNYRTVVDDFAPVPDSCRTIEEGCIRRITQTESSSGHSSIETQVIAYADCPFIEVRYRIQWNERNKRLKLSIPTRFRSPVVLCDVPGGAIPRPADGEEQVHGRWMVLEGRVEGEPTALGIVTSGQHGFDLKDGEIRLSVLRSPLYCHERTFSFTNRTRMRHMDQGVHEMRLLLTAGDPDEIRNAVSGLADWLNSPPFALAHLPIGENASASQELIEMTPRRVRLIAFKRSWDGNALLCRLQETVGSPADVCVRLRHPAITLSFRLGPFEIKTLRVERDGRWSEVGMIEEIGESAGH